MMMIIIIIKLNNIEEINLVKVRDKFLEEEEKTENLEKNSVEEEIISEKVERICIKEEDI